MCPGSDTWATPKDDIIWEKSAKSKKQPQHEDEGSSGQEGNNNDCI
jgi:hypothetical protein